MEGAAAILNPRPISIRAAAAYTRGQANGWVGQSAGDIENAGASGCAENHGYAIKKKA